MGITADVKFEMNDVNQILASHGLDRGSKVQQYMATQLIGLMDCYVPFRSGVLKGSAIRNLAPPYETIIYDGPYARRHYYNAAGTDILGRRFGPATFNETPRRGAFWDKKAWSMGKDTFLHNLEQAIKRGRLS